MAVSLYAQTPKTQLFTLYAGEVLPSSRFCVYQLSCGHFIDLFSFVFYFVFLCTSASIKVLEKTVKVLKKILTQGHFSKQVHKCS